MAQAPCQELKKYKSDLYLLLLWSGSLYSSFPPLKLWWVLLRSNDFPRSFGTAASQFQFSLTIHHLPFTILAVPNCWGYLKVAQSLELWRLSAFSLAFHPSKWVRGKSFQFNYQRPWYFFLFFAWLGFYFFLFFWIFFGRVARLGSDFGPAILPFAVSQCTFLA